MLATFFSNIISRAVKHKSDAIILILFLCLVLVSLIFGAYWHIYWLLKISCAVSCVVVSIILYKYSVNGLPTFETRLQWIEGTPMNVTYQTESDISFGATMLSLLFAVVFDILAIIVFFLNNTTIFHLCYLIFILILAVVIILVFILLSLKR